MAKAKNASNDKKAGTGQSHKVILRNKRARHEYFIEETIEAGISLLGSEVKSLRAGRAELGDAYASITNGEAFLQQMQISEYSFANQFGHAPKRVRKLLLHKQEIQHLDEAVHRSGYTLLPLEIYLKEGRIKVLLGLGKGKKQYDKREDEKEREAKLDMARHR
jgi:SsrA-binding protein